MSGFHTMQDGHPDLTIILEARQNREKNGLRRDSNLFTSVRIQARDGDPYRRRSITTETKEKHQRTNDANSRTLVQDHHTGRPTALTFRKSFTATLNLPKAMLADPLR